MHRSLVWGISAVALPVAAYGQPVSGLYVSGAAGVNVMQDETVSIASFAVTGKESLRAGPAVVGAVGWGFGNGLRVELEGSFRDNQYHSASGFGLPVSLGGWEQKFGPMVNVAYDFNGVASWIVPYLGLGIGYQWVYPQSGRSSGSTFTASVQNASKGNLAYQAIIGAAMPIAAIPGLAFTTEYRFMGLAGSRTYNATITSGGVTAPATFTQKGDYNHSFLIGFRYNFGVAPPPAPAPAAVPAQAPSRSYLVFFDWDKATLTDRARQIISEAAANSTKVQYTRIEVNGYTDTSGTHQYNQGLSIRRAKAVQAELVKDGVPQNAITIQGFGDTHLLVPTGPGVREPQNRRVEIIIR